MKPSLGLLVHVMLSFLSFDDAKVGRFGQPASVSMLLFAHTDRFFDVRQKNTLLGKKDGFCYLRISVEPVSDASEASVWMA